MNSEGEQEKSGFDRRSLIKAGVAGGVAAAAWAAPTIRSASVVALDAANCTAPIQTFYSDSVETNQGGCSSFGGNHLTYGPASGSQVNVTVFGYGGLIIFPDNNGTTCSASPGPSYSLVPSNANRDLECDISLIRVYRQSNGALVASIPGTTTGKMPQIPKSNLTANSRVEATIECCPKANWYG